MSQTDDLTVRLSNTTAGEWKDFSNKSLQWVSGFPGIQEKGTI